MQIGGTLRFDGSDQFVPLFTRQAEVGTEVEQGALSHLVTDANRLDQAKREVVGSVLGSGFDFADEHEVDYSVGLKNVNIYINN